MDKAGTVPMLAYSIVALALTYAAWTARHPPTHVRGLLSSSYFTSTMDAPDRPTESGRHS